MPSNRKAKGEMLLGTLDMLILQTLLPGPNHAHSIAHSIERGSDDILQVEHGSLYPALYRLEDRGWIAGREGRSEEGRPIRVYRLTAAGRRQLAEELEVWRLFSVAIDRVVTG